MSSWTHFFRDAGIPLSAAKSYASTFEENRIGMDMLLDLNKEILTDMGIKVMGDIIAILKHAKKEARKREHSSSSAPSSKPAPAQAAAVSTTSSARRTNHAPPPAAISEEVLADSWSQETLPPVTTAVDVTLVPKDTYIAYQGPNGLTLVETERLQPVVEPAVMSYGTLRSNEVLQQQPVPVQYYVEEGEGPEVTTMLPIDAGVDQGVTYMEEYTTPAYEMTRKRPFDGMYAEVSNQPEGVVGASPGKQPRVIVLPAEAKRDASATGIVASGGRNRRLLQAAGLVPAAQRDRAAPGSVFSRLDLSTTPSKPVTTTVTVSPTRLSRVTPNSQTRTIAVETSSSTSSPKPKSIKVTLKGKPAATSSSGSATTATRQVKGKRSVVGRVTGTSEGQRPVTSSTRLSDRLGTVSTSTTPTGLKARLGTKQPEPRRQRQAAERKDRTTAHRRSKSKSSMVADEYETVRQIDIRSRLERRESEKAARRKGPLSGRLGQHQVFGRLE